MWYKVSKVEYIDGQLINTSIGHLKSKTDVKIFNEVYVSPFQDWFNENRHLFTANSTVLSATYIANGEYDEKLNLPEIIDFGNPEGV